MNIKIYFGEVKSVEDDQKLFRCRVSINGHTNEIETENLPWYYPWYGVNFLPEEGDKVPIIIFDDNFASGFYGKKVGITSSSFSDKDYKNYLEIFSRNVGGDLVELSYKESDGIIFVNHNSLINIETDKLLLMCKDNYIEITQSEIKIGNNAEQYALLGENVQDLLKEILDYMGQICKIFGTTSPTMISFTAACGVPYTAPLLPSFQKLGIDMATMYTSIATLSGKIDLILSNKTKIE